MLTKWGNALGLASAGRIVSLAGGGPLGNATIWGAVGNWADLSTIPAGDIRNGDEVPVNGLGTSHSSGIAQRHGSEWRLIEGKWNSVADMLAWNTTPGQVVHSGAFAQVKSGGGHDDDSVTYIYQSGNWVRFAGLTAGYAWAISSLRDFSAIGLQDGDFGILTPSGGQPIMLRYKAACTTAYGSPIPAWMTPIAYAGTPIVQAWTDGTESNVTLAAQGWTLVADSAGCTVTATGGFQRLTTPTSQNAMRLHTMVNGVAAATRMESIFETRASTAGTNVLAIYFITDGTNCSILGQVGTLGLGWKDAAFGGPLQTPLRNATATALPTLAQTAAFIVMRDEGRTVLSSADRDGLPLGNYRRNLQTLAANRIAVTAQGSAGGVAATLDYRGQIITY